MKEEEKRQILRDIRTKDVDELWNYIQSGEITLDEMKDNGLRREVKLELEKRSKKEDEKREIEKDFWEQCLKEYTLNSFIRYQQAYPHGLYITQCNAYITEIHVKNAAKKVEILQEMEDYPDNFTPERIKKLFEEGIIEKYDMIEREIITERALKLYLNPPEVMFMDQKSWSSLPPIPNENTDVYFFGIPGSGKSCVLAGMLYLAERKGILDPDITSPFGYRYMNELKNCIKIGYVPRPTSEESVNYLSFSLKGKENHPLSVIEMSGELFKNTYKEVIGLSDNKQTIGAKDYLKNNNRKAIFFVIDYQAEFSDRMITEASSQQDMLTGVLQLLKQDGTLTKTDTIQIIISKSDHMPQNEEREVCARMFLNEHYLNFMRLLEEVCREFNINKPRNYKPVIIPFSLGRFMLGRTFEYNPDDSVILVDSLLNLTSTKNGQPWWKKL